MPFYWYLFMSNFITCTFKCKWKQPKNYQTYFVSIPLCLIVFWLCCRGVRGVSTSLFLIVFWLCCRHVWGVSTSLFLIMFWLCCRHVQEVSTSLFLIVFWLCCRRVRGVSTSLCLIVFWLCCRRVWGVRLWGGTQGLEPQERPPPVWAGTLHFLRRTALHGDRVWPTNITMYLY